MLKVNITYYRIIEHSRTGICNIDNTCLTKKKYSPVDITLAEVISLPYGVNSYRKSEQWIIESFKVDKV